MIPKSSNSGTYPKNPYGNLNLQKIKDLEETFINTANWWESEINKAGQQLRNESQKENPDIELVETLRQKIDYLQTKGAMEERKLNEFDRIKKQYLLNNLLSGVSTFS